jgi:F-type H+-transporting ATPase subunit delta
MRDLLRGYAVATLESAAAAERARGVADDLAAFSRAFRDSEPLHSVLTDVAIPVTARRGVVHDLLEAKSTAQAEQLISWAVLVEPAAELPAALFELVELAGDIAEVADAGGTQAIGAEEVLGGRTAVRERIRGFADRLFQEAARRESIDELENEVVRFSRIVAANRELRQVLTDPNRPVGLRVTLVADLLQGKVQPATARLAAYVLRAGHVRDLVGTLEWVAALAAEERGRRVANVRSAVGLDDSEYQRLTVALERWAGHPVEIRVQIDPALMGGMAVAIGDTIIDGSVRRRLDRLRETLAPSNASQAMDSRR